MEIKSDPSVIAVTRTTLADLLNPQQTAEYTGLTVPTLQRLRTEGTGPCFIKLGKRRVAYRLSDIRSWLDERVAASTADARDRGLTS